MRNTFVSKTDLAQAFFPFISPESARHKLMQLLNDDTSLMKKLKKNGYAPTSHNFSPAQVELIVGKYGNPWK